MNRMLKTAGCLIMVAAIAGCEGMGRTDNYTGEHAVYQPPQLPNSQVATVTGTWGTFIEAVDDVQLPKEKTYFPAWTGGIGGNETSVLPGPRKLELFVTVNDEYDRKEFTFDFQPGHAYELARAFNVDDDVIRIHDKTNGDLRYIR